MSRLTVASTYFISTSDPKEDRGKRNLADEPVVDLTVPQLSRFLLRELVTSNIELEFNCP